MIVMGYVKCAIDKRNPPLLRNERNRETTRDSTLLFDPVGYNNRLLSCKSPPNKLNTSLFRTSGILLLLSILSLKCEAFLSTLYTFFVDCQDV